MRYFLNLQTVLVTTNLTPVILRKIYVTYSKDISLNLRNDCDEDLTYGKRSSNEQPRTEKKTVKARQS